MTFRDLDFESAILESAYSDKALGYILRCRDWALKTVDKQHKDFEDEAIKYYLRLSDAYAATRCDCCGAELKNPNHRGNMVLGECCVRHPELFPCHSQASSNSVGSSGREAADQYLGR